MLGVRSTVSQPIEITSQTDDEVSISLTQLSQPQTQQQPANTHIISEWKYKNNKDKGVTDAGRIGGFYEDPNDPNSVVLFKQDPVIVKNICEVVAGKLMRLVAGEAANSVAEVNFAIATGTEILPDASGKNVYVASRVFNDRLDLYEDAVFAYRHLDRYEPLRLQNPPQSLHLPQCPRIHQSDPMIDKIIVSGRYKNMALLLALSLLVDDPDVNFGNFVTVPSASRSEQNEIKGIIVDNQKKMLYDQVEAKRIDFGSALGDDRIISARTFDDKLHLDDFFRYFPLFGGAPNYFRAYPEEILHQSQFYLALAQISAFPRAELQKGVNDIIDEVGRFYGPAPLLSFAHRIGAPIYIEKNAPNNKAEIMQQIKDFMFRNLVARQNHALKISLQMHNDNAHQDEEHLREQADDELDHFLEMRERHYQKFALDDAIYYLRKQRAWQMTQDQEAQELADALDLLSKTIKREMQEEKSVTLEETIYPIVMDHFAELTNRLADRSQKLTRQDIYDSMDRLDAKLKDKKPMSTALKFVISIVAGAVLGFVIGFIPGAIAGAVTGFFGGLIASENARRYKKEYQLVSAHVETLKTKMTQSLPALNLS